MIVRSRLLQAQRVVFVSNLPAFGSGRQGVWQVASNSSNLRGRLQPRASYASAASQAAAGASRLKNWTLSTVILAGVGLSLFYVTDTRAGVHEWLIVPLLRAFVGDAEEAHAIGTTSLKTLYDIGLHPRERASRDKNGDLQIEVFGHTLSNPIGISAGLDKNADIPSALFELGPGIVEVGGITPLPQEGNPKPRVFRVPSQDALINRYGLNSKGAEQVALQLRQRVREYAKSMGFGMNERAEQFVLNGGAGVPPGSLVPGRLLAVQIAKNKGTPEGDIAAVREDYEACARTLGKYADIIVLNVSSPNTPGLRSLQQSEPLRQLLEGVVNTVRKIDRKTKPAVMVKVSPDEDSEEQVLGICHAVWRSGVDGVIVGNTTKQRPDPSPQGYVLSQKEASVMLEQGGYSGPQMFERTLALVKKYKKNFDEALLVNGAENTESPVIFATGGITNGAQALEVLNAGASIAMVYTSLVYGGVGTITRLKGEMRSEIAQKMKS